MVLTDAGWRVDTLVAKGWASFTNNNHQCFRTDHFYEHRLFLTGGKMHPNQWNPRPNVSMISW